MASSADPLPQHSEDQSSQLQNSRDIALVLVAICIAWLASRFVIYPALNVPGYAPMILRPIAGVLVAWYLLRLAGQRWSDYGLRRPAHWAIIPVGGVLVYVVLWLTSAYIVPQLAQWLDFKGGPSIMGYVRGNLLALGGWLTISWLVGALSEELLFRGFLLNKVASLAGTGRLAYSMGVLFQAFLFGLLHLYQGTFGFLFGFTFALILGVAYLLCGKNLWALVVVHGVWNSAGFVALYNS